MARADEGVASWSQASLRQRLTQPKIRAIPQRRDWTVKPYCPSGALTMAKATGVVSATRWPV